MVRIRVATWNLGYWQFRRHHERAWEYLRQEIKPDIAFLQECHPINVSADEQIFFKEIYRGWGTAIYVRSFPAEEIEFFQYPGRVVGAVAYLPKIPRLYLASIHAPILNHRVFPHLDDIFSEIEGRYAGLPSIIGGDLNSARLAEEAWPGYGHGPFFKRIDQSWFVDCRRHFFEAEIQTIFRPRQKFPFQDDHIFVSQDLADRVSDYQVLHNGVTRTVSDHIPVVIDIAF